MPMEDVYKRQSISRMGKNRRVVVTGMGAITPIGNSVEEFWNGIKEGKTGFGSITYFDTADYRCKLAAEVKNFDPAQYLSLIHI